MSSIFSRYTEGMKSQLDHKAEKYEKISQNNDDPIKTNFTISVTFNAWLDGRVAGPGVKRTIYLLYFYM